MDLLPITDMAQSAQIAQYGALANDKLKEASGILQSALDTHMLLSNFDAYKQFSNDVSDQINELTKSAGTQDSEGAFSLSDLYNEAQGKLTKVKGYYNQAKQFQSDVQKLFTPFNCPGNPSGYCPYVSEYPLVWGDDCLRKCDGGLSLPLAYRCLWCSYAD